MFCACRPTDKTLLNLPSPRYLGEAMSPGAIYVASFHDNMAEILCFRGNMVNSINKENDEPDIHRSLKKKLVLLEFMLLLCFIYYCIFCAYPLPQLAKIKYCILSSSLVTILYIQQWQLSASACIEHLIGSMKSIHKIHVSD